MNLYERIDAEWDEFKAKARTKWAKLQDTDWNEIESEAKGRWDRFTNKVKAYYNQTTDEIQDAAEGFFDDDTTDGSHRDAVSSS